LIGDGKPKVRIIENIPTIKHRNTEIGNMFSIISDMQVFFYM
jgi:hypothetical protein